jgi:hypothetical protein
MVDLLSKGGVNKKESGWPALFGGAYYKSS